MNKYSIKIYTLFFSLLFLLPSLQNIFNLFPKQKLAGVEYAAPFPDLAFAQWMNGSFQKGFESWYSKIYGLRDYFVRTENQINYALFGQVITKLVIGKQNQLYERAYIVDYIKRDNQLSEKEIQKYAVNLKKLQNYLELRGIKFLFIISPSKAAIYPEYIPDYYTKIENNQDTTNYEKLVPLLKQNCVNYMDGYEFTAYLKRNDRYPLFPKGGTHWNYYTALLFTQKLIQKITEMIGKPLNFMVCEKVEVLDIAFRTDADLANLTNLWFPAPFIEKSIFPVVKQVMVPGAVRPKVLFVGGSFVDTILYWVNKFNVFYRGSEFNRYFSRKIASKDDEIFNNDVIILETNMQAISRMGFGFIDAVLKTPEFAQKISTASPPKTMSINEKLKLYMTIKNTGIKLWEATNERKPVLLSYHWIDSLGKRVVYGGLRTRLPHDISSGQSVNLIATVKAPPLPGKYTLRFTMVQEHVAWFDEKGAKPLDIPVTITQ